MLGMWVICGGNVPPMQPYLIPEKKTMTYIYDTTKKQTSIGLIGFHQFAEVCFVYRLNFPFLGNFPFPKININ